MEASPVILFDGVCGLCNFWVTFILERDIVRQFRFAPLQSSAGRALLRAHSCREEHLDSVVFIANDRVYVKSAAVFEILRRLGFPWSLLRLFVLIPAPVRDFIYNIVAKHRYRWFGTRNTCRLPTLSERSQFLECQDNPKAAEL